MHNTPDEFDRMMSQEYLVNPQPAFVDPAPYGIPVNSSPKPGLTPRGKAALAFGATVIAGGSLLGWQHYSAQQAAAETKALELSLKQQELRIQEIRELNKAQVVTAQAQSTQDAARQKNIDTCVDTNKGLVGKQLGVTYRSVVEDCQAQYPATSSGSDMQAAAATDPTSSSGGGVNAGLLLGGAVLAAGLTVAYKKSTKSNPA